MKFLFSTGSLWSYSVERCFALAARVGFDGMEIMVDQRWDTRQADFLAQVVARYGLPVMAIHSPFWPSVPGWPADQPGRIAASIQLAEAVGAAVVVHHLPAAVGHVTLMTGSRFTRVPLPWNPESDYRRWLENDYFTLQAQTSVQLCIENMPAYRRLGRRWNLYHWNRPQDMVRFPTLTLDTTHLGTWGMDPAAIYPQLEGRVRHIHLSNYNGQEHRRPETGELCLDRFVGRLADGGYQGCVTLELYPDVLDAGRADDLIVERLATSLKHCRAWAGA